MRTRSMNKYLILAAVLVAGLATARDAGAQEIQVTGPLKGAPAVRHLRLYRKSRFELAPTASFTFLDEYRRTILVGGRLQYNITDWLGVGVWGAYGAASLTTDLTDQIDRHADRTHPMTKPNVSPYAGGFVAQTGRLQWMAAPQVQFVPFRGKLSIFQLIFVDADAYLHGGIAFVGVQERANCGGTGQLLCTDPESFGLASRVAVAPTFGLGLNFYFAKFMSLGLEYRAVPFSWNRAGFDTHGAGPGSRFPDGKVDSRDQTFKFNQLISVGIGFSFPVTPKISN